MAIEFGDCNAGLLHKGQCLLSTGRVTGCQTKLRVAPKGIHNAGNAGKHIIPLRCDMGQKPVVVMYMQLAQKWMFQPFNAAYLLKLMVRSEERRVGKECRSR